MVVIRPAWAADAAQLADVQRDSWLAAYDGIIAREIIEQGMPPDGGARIRQTFRTRPWQQMIVAVDEPPGAVGYASFGPEVDVLGAPWPHPRTEKGAAGETGELYALYVHPDWWSTGTGQALMDQVLASTRAAAYTEIVLWVLEANARARKFYERAGFAPDGASTVLVTLGAVTEVRYRRPLLAPHRPPALN